MNYYSIEFFKHYLPIIKKSLKDKEALKILKVLQDYVRDREDNNKDAYSTKYFTKPIFQ